MNIRLLFSTSRIITMTQSLSLSRRKHFKSTLQNDMTFVLFSILPCAARDVRSYLIQSHYSIAISNKKEIKLRDRKICR